MIFGSQKIQNCSERRTACSKPPLKSWTEFRNTKMEKGMSQFCWSAGQCGVHAGMPLGCPLPASLREITSFSKKPSFLGNHSKYVGNQQPRPRPRTRHAAKGGGEILQKKKKRRVGCRILIGVIEANLNFSSGLMDVKLFCSELFRS